MDVAKREALIESLMKRSGMDRQQAEFAAAIEFGDIKGDVIEIDEAPSDKSAQR